MTQRVGLSAFWKQYDRKTYLKAAILADKLGYESFWVPEAWGYEQFSLLAEIAVHTKRIKLGTGITNVFSRTPALIAMQAATLDEISGGRLILGIGTSGKRVVEGLHGRPFEKPLTQVRDVIRAVRTLTAGGKLSDAGMKLNTYRPFALEIDPVRKHIPIFVAAIKPDAIRSIGEMADGWMPIFYPYQEIEKGRRFIAEGAQRVGRDPSEIVTAPFTSLIPLPGNQANRKARELIAFYVGGMGDYYKELLTNFGYGAECDEIERLYKDKATRSRAEDAVTSEMIDALTISGNPLHCRRELKRREQYGFEHPVLGLPPGVPWSVMAAFIAINAPSRFV